ncbi:MAG: TonB-dependent receptor [Gammaproteobacteria bacterium]|nr:TonB-dependent receptor [Gammaproteobacteria bacterium]
MALRRFAVILLSGFCASTLPSVLFAQVAEEPAVDTADTAEEAPAAEEESSFALEEIVVTARKVTESLQDAPLSVVVLDGEQLIESGVSRIEELVAYVPNFAMSETGIGTNLYVRGIGSGINQGFEQSVGLYIDSIYYGRAQLTRVPFLDLAQAESLRGPQAILLGNNSIAGAMNLTTARPTDTFESSINALYEPDHEEEEITAMISGPLFGNWGARLAGRYRSMAGYLENTTLGGRDEPDREEESIRLTLARDGDLFDAALKLEHNSFDVKGRQIEIVQALPSLDIYRTGDNGLGIPPLTSATGFSRGTGSADFWRSGYTYLDYLGTFFDTNPIDPVTFDPDADYVPGIAAHGDGTLDYRRGANGDSSENDVDAAVLTMDWDFNGYILTSVSGFLTYEYSEICDCDFTGATQFNLLSEEKYDQWSQEIRIVSPTENRFRWLAGAYYQHDELEFGDQIFLPIDSGVVRLVGYATDGDPQGAFDALGNTSAFRNFDQNTSVSSVFTQLGTDIVEDVWRVSLGLRYSHVEKEASRILREGDLERNPFVLGVQPDDDLLTAGAPLFARIFNVAFHQLAGSRTENSVAWEFVTEFDATEDVLVYGSVKTGFKSGGFDARSNSEPEPGTTGSGILFPESTQATVQANVAPGSFEFEDERAISYELGTKVTALADTLQFGIAAFYTEFDDLQVSIFDGTLGFNVGNAAKATTMGVELDGRWALAEGLTLTGSLGLLDFEFDDFKGGQCNQGQVPTFPSNLPPTDPNYAFRGKCDYTGRTNQYVADWSGALALNYEVPVGDFLFKATLDTQFTDDYNPSQNLDPRIVQDKYATWNLRLAVADDEKRWEIAVLGRNLTDEEIITYANDTPLAFSQFGTPTFYGFVDRPRNVALQARVRFGD